MATTKLADGGGMVAILFASPVPSTSSPVSSPCSLHKKNASNVDVARLRVSASTPSRSLKLYSMGNFEGDYARTETIQARRMRTKLRARQIVMAQATTGSAAMLAKEMERVAAKEALLLSIKDAGGLKGLGNPSEDDKAQIEVNEKVLNLERLNPTPRPTTSPDLEGLWQFEWAAARSPGVIAASTILGNFPSGLASIDSLTLLVLDGSTKATGTIKIFNTVESSFTLVTKLTVKGPVRIQEEYVEGLVSTPTVPEGPGATPLTGLFKQLSSLAAQLPGAARDVVSGGIRLPLSGTFARELIISYLDDEVLVARDKSGVPDVLRRVVAQSA